jgi:hypothetical protein
MFDCLLKFAQQFIKEFTLAWIQASDKDMIVANAWWSIIHIVRMAIYGDSVARCTRGWKGFAECKCIKPGSVCTFIFQRSGRCNKLRATVHVLLQAIDHSHFSICSII